MENMIRNSKEMAANDWIRSYLEAILDVGNHRKQSFSVYLSPRVAAQAVTPSRYSPTKYFVEEIVTRFDDSDLYKTWIKVVATRNDQERNSRMENICWRIWHLSRKKKQIEWEEARLLVKKRAEIRDVGSEDLSELSEGEKEKNGNGAIPRIDSETNVWSSVNGVETKRLYIVLISLHGLVRGENMELGRDSDTGGQVKYVVELARALAVTKGVYRVDLLTRQISSPDVHWTYGEPVEMLTHDMEQKADINGECSGAYIIRLPCGPCDRYIHKEALWPYIPEFVDHALTHITNVARSLGESSKLAWPYIIHGHYADAADVAAHLSGLLNVPMVMTGHSLGRNKLEQLVKHGRLTRAEINSTYNIVRRIEAEEFGLDAADMVITSTRQEVEEQWGLYDGFDVRLERKLRVRRRRGVSCLGRCMPRMVVIPPGMDFSYVSAQELGEGDGDISSLFGSDKGQSRIEIHPVWSEIMRFFRNPHKPMILALSRPDPKKNVTTLLKAFGECQELRELANLTLILGNRDDIEEMHGSSNLVLTDVLKLVDRYDLYGQVSYPKHHKQSDVPEIYKLAAKTKGVFVNPALVEPFGLTLIEAAAYGLPVVATKNGGPVDILKALKNGLLVDPHDHNAISKALLKLVGNKNLWLECRNNGLKNIHLFSWPEHCQKYLSHAEHCRMLHTTASLNTLLPENKEPIFESVSSSDDISIQLSIGTNDVKSGSDITATLLEAFQKQHHEHVQISSPFRRQNICVIATDCYDSNGDIMIGQILSVTEKAMEVFGKDKCSDTGFVFATGSTLEEATEVLGFCKVALDDFDALICSSGSEIYYPWKDLIADAEYSERVRCRWPAEHVKSWMNKLTKVDDTVHVDDIKVDENACGLYCYAYSVKNGSKAKKVDYIRQGLRMRGFRCNVVYTRACTRLNVIPLFASRTNALRYLSIKWGFSLSKMTVMVGEKGDTDHEELLPGIHKTVIIKGCVFNGSERLLKDEESSKMEGVAMESLNVEFLAE